MLTDPMRHRSPGLALRATLFLLLSCLTVQAQSISTAQLNGSVKDHVSGGSAYHSARAEVLVLIRRQSPR